MRLQLSIGGWAVDTGRDPQTEVIDVQTFAALGSPARAAGISMYSAPAGARLELPGPLGSGAPFGGDAGSGTVIRGETIAPGDMIRVALGGDDSMHEVLTAEVDEIRSSPGVVHVTARNQLQRLAGTRLSVAYEGQSTARIAEDLARRSGVRTGRLAAGATHPWVVVHESRSVLSHLLALAALEGMDVFDEPDGALTIRPFERRAADHTLRYATDLLEVQVDGHDSGGTIAVAGESPTSREGSERWYWLANDVRPFTSQAGEGRVRLSVQDATVRTKSLADAASDALRRRLVRHARAGRARLLGRPDLLLGQAIEIVDAPRAELNGTFGLTAVAHRYSRRRGFVTDIEFGAYAERAA